MTSSIGLGLFNTIVGAAGVAACTKAVSVGKFVVYLEVRRSKQVLKCVPRLFDGGE